MTANLTALVALPACTEQAGNANYAPRRHSSWQTHRTQILWPNRFGDPCPSVPAGTGVVDAEGTVVPNDPRDWLKRHREELLLIVFAATASALAAKVLDYVL